MNELKVSPITIMKELGRMIKQYNELPDEDFFYDRLYFMKHNYDNDNEVFKSSDIKDKVMVLNYGLETCNIILQQIMRFNRIVYSTDSGVVYNFPKNEIPKFQIDDIFNKTKTNTIKQNTRNTI